MDIVIKGRNVEVPDHYREHVTEKLTRLERYNKKAIRADVELLHERNPRQAKNCQRVEITLVGKGEPIRAEASAGDFYAALDGAASKLENRLRRMHDRRKVHYGQRNPESVAEATAGLADRPVAPAGNAEQRAGRTALLEAPAEPATGGGPGGDGSGGPAPSGGSPEGGGPTAGAGPAVQDEVPETMQRSGTVPEQRAAENGYEPGRIVREKDHPGMPMTVDQALSEMELVGHDFYLFADADSGRPSVVYRRRGFDYGVIRLAGSH
ncbi:ribosome-associated translation inhibitor RaiA [Saccharopolyspora sp. HNM0983]|uniref:Ribosome hibernation promoting factor n=1 Tax=Saccharopolyspora montiporae TaxID=2781240 RepID=A0A929BF69_9PSEU|nr:ribosome-associated translation inhibitor RaiA [Saccharopolyspora sp. HNM0983]MBE9376347.1 ribosome-associated translation inhibitor RaiA [Saccharopolyspora sp. HNM0983]